MFHTSPLQIRKIRYICRLQRGPSCLVICIDLLVAGEVGEIVKIASEAMQSLVGDFDNFANFVVACISGHKWNRATSFPWSLFFPSPGARETLVWSGHVRPKVWDVAKKRIVGGAVKFTF